MKKQYRTLSFICIIAIIFWSYIALIPQNTTQKGISKTQFSLEKAYNHVVNMSTAPHYVGSMQPHGQPGEHQLQEE